MKKDKQAHGVSFLKRFMKRKTAVVGAIILIIIFAAVIFGPILSDVDPFAQNTDIMNQPPSAEHLLGTDYLGRDVLTRMMYGGRISLGISFGGVITGSLIGIFLGVCAGYFGKWVDNIISGLITVLLSFPGLLLAMLVVAILGKGTLNTMFAVMVFNIPTMARVVRGLVIQNKNQEYIQSCRTIGASNLRIIILHLIPNCSSQIIVNITLSFGTAILSASGLSFLGLGVQPPNPEWGAMLSQARTSVMTYPLGVIIPGLAIMLVVLGFSLLGDGLRDALDPKLKNR